MGTRPDDDRRAVNGIFVLRTGAPCRDLPDRYGPRIMRQPLRAPGQARYPAERVRGLGPALAAVIAVDRQVHRPRPPARLGPKKAGEDLAVGRSRGGLSTKIHDGWMGVAPAGPSARPRP